MMNPIFLIAFPLLAAFLSILSKKLAPVLLLLIALLNTVMAIFIPMGIVGIGGFSPIWNQSICGYVRANRTSAGEWTIYRHRYIKYQKI